MRPGALAIFAMAMSCLPIACPAAAPCKQPDSPMKLPMGGVADVGVDAVLDRLDEEALQPSLMFASTGGGSHCLQN